MIKSVASADSRRDLEAMIKSTASTDSLGFAGEQPSPGRLREQPASSRLPDPSGEAALAGVWIGAAELTGELA